MARIQQLSIRHQLLGALTLVVMVAGLIGWLLFTPNPEQTPEEEFAALLTAAAFSAATETADDAQVAERARDIPVFTARLKQPLFGDWPVIKARRAIRVVVPYSRTFFYNDNGNTRGISADLLAELERHINRTFKTGRQPISVIAIPVARDQLLPALEQGIADIAVGNLTITPDRQERVDFVGLKKTRVNEILVSGPEITTVLTEPDLAGKEIAVRRSSSYYQSLLALNERLDGAGLDEVHIVIVPEELEDEDLLEMVDAGLLPYTIADDWKVSLWRAVLPQIIPHPEIVVRADAQIGWAIRKESPELLAVLEGFRDKAEQQALANLKFAEYQQRIARMGNAYATGDWARVEESMGLFERYGGQYDFDHLLLLAQGYQESRLNQQARSGAGAVGIMQLLPSTGKSMQVGDINQLEPNIHAGVKYLRHLHDQYFNDPEIDKVNQALFSLAGYNAGPNAIARMRRIAAQQGLDPNRWFGQVEVVTGQKIGLEPVRYVRNIVKYYVAYRQVIDRQKARASAIEEMKNN